MKRTLVERVDWLSLLPLLLIGAGCISVIATQQRMSWVDLVFDDAYYYLGVARSIVENKVSSFLPPFETNGYQPLWLLLLVVTGFLFGTGETALPIQALALSTIFVFLFALGSKLHYGKAWPAVLSVVAFPLVTLYGLETAMLPFFLVLFFRSKDWRATGILSAAIFLTRLDALSIVVARDMYRMVVKRDFSSSLKHWLILLPVIGGYFLLNLFYFGTPVPISGLAKAVGNVHGENLLPLLLFWQTSRLLIVISLVLFLFTRIPAAKIAMKYEEEIFSTLAALAICAVYYTVMSGWPVWPWYVWPVMFLSFLLLQESVPVLRQWKNLFGSAFYWVPFVLLGYLVFFNMLPKAARTLDSYSSAFQDAYKGEFTGDSFGRDNVQLVGELLDRKPPDGTYFAMGDRAGSFGYFLGNRFRFFHTEGLVGPYEYLSALRQDAGEQFVQGLAIDYLVVDRQAYFENEKLIGVVEPIQPMSAHRGPYLLCFAKSGIVNEKVRAHRRRLVLEFRSRTECPGDFKEKFYRLRARYGGIRSFSLPDEHREEGPFKFFAPAADQARPLESGPVG